MKKQANSDYFGYNSFISKQGERVRRIRRTQLSAQKLSRSNSRKSSITVRNQISRTKAHEKVRVTNLLTDRSTDNYIESRKNTRTQSNYLNQESPYLIQVKQNIREGNQMGIHKKSDSNALSNVKERITQQKNKKEKFQLKTDKPQLLNKPSFLNKSGQRQFCYLKQKYDNLTKQNLKDSSKYSKTGKFTKIKQQYTSVVQRPNQGIDFQLIDKIVKQNLKSQYENSDDLYIDNLIMNRKIGVSKFTHKKSALQSRCLLMNKPQVVSRIFLSTKNPKNEISQFVQNKEQLKKNNLHENRMLEPNSNQNLLNQSTEIPPQGQLKQQYKISIGESRRSINRKKQSNIPYPQHQAQHNQLIYSSESEKCRESKKQELFSKINPSMLQSRKVVNRAEPRQPKSKAHGSKIKSHLRGKTSQIRSSVNNGMFKNLPLDSRAQYNFKASDLQKKNTLIKKQKDGSHLNVFDKIQSHQLIISFIVEFIEGTKQFYGQQISDNTLKLLFLLYRKVYYEKANLYKALKGVGLNCFFLSGIEITDEELSQQLKNPQIIGKIKVGQNQTKQLFKQFESLFKRIKNIFSNDPYIKIETPKDNFSNQVVYQLFLELNQLYPKLQVSNCEDSLMLLIEDRIIQIIQLIFLISEFHRRKVKPFQFASEIEDFEFYYEKYYDQMIKTVDFFQNQFQRF